MQLVLFEVHHVQRCVALDEMGDFSAWLFLEVSEFSAVVIAPLNYLRVEFIKS